MKAPDQLTIFICRLCGRQKRKPFRTHVVRGVVCGGHPVAITYAREGKE